MVERGKERRSMQPSDSNTLTANVAQRDENASPTTRTLLENQSDRSTHIWMGESIVDVSNVTTSNVPKANEVIYAQPEKKSMRKSSESKSSFHSAEKNTIDSPVNKEPSVKPNANESRNVDLENTGSKKKDEVVYAMPEKKTSIRKVTTDDGSQVQEVKGHGEDANPRQTSRENSEMPYNNDESGAPLNSEATSVPRKATDGGVVYALPIKKSGSIKVMDGGEDDYATLRDGMSRHEDYAALRDETSTDKSKEVSATPRVSSGYEDLVIGESPLSVPDNVPNLPPDVKLKSTSLPAVKKIPKKPADKTEGSGKYHIHDAKGHTYAQSMKKCHGVNALNTSSFDDSMTPISPTSSERLKLVRSVILDPWSGRSEFDTGNLHSKKKSSKESGYEEVNLGEMAPPFSHEMPRIPPDAVEKLGKQSEKDRQNTYGTKGEADRHELRNLNDLHQIADDGSIYTIPMKKVPSTKRSVKEVVCLGPGNQTRKSSVEMKSDYEDIDLGDIKPPNPSEVASYTSESNGEENSDPAYAISRVVDTPEITSKADQRPVEQKAKVSKETVLNAEKKQPTPRKCSTSENRSSGEEAMVVLGTPGKKNPSLRESGKPPSTVIIPDQPVVHSEAGAPDTMLSGASITSSLNCNDDISTTKTSRENESDDPAYAISMVTTPQSPSSGHRNHKNKGPARPPPPPATMKSRKESLETKQIPSDHSSVRNRAHRGAPDTMVPGASIKSSLDRNDDISTTTTSGENESDDPAYAISMVTTPQSPSSGHRNHKNKGPARPPPPTTTTNTRKGSLETKQIPSDHSSVRNRAQRGEDKEEVMVELGTPGIKNPSIRTPEGRVTPIDISKKSTGK